MKSAEFERDLASDAVSVVEAAAIAAAALVGRGDEKAADQVAVDAMRTALNSLDIDGKIVIGEGERDEAPMLYIGEKVGTGRGPRVDIALDPLEGTTLTAQAMANSVAVLACAKGVDVADITACVLDRPRHAEIIASLRRVGARVLLITDGDVAGVIHTTDPETGIDLYVGQGGAPEGVLACAALKCVGGQFQGRLVFRNTDERTRAKRWGITDLDRKYDL